jgi:hypothetical protein
MGDYIFSLQHQYFKFEDLTSVSSVEPYFPVSVPGHLVSLSSETTLVLGREGGDTQILLKDKSAVGLGNI